MAVDRHKSRTDLVRIPMIGSPAYHVLEDFLNQTMSPGVIKDMLLSDGGSGTLDVDSGSGFIRISNSDISQLVSFDYTGVTGEALVDNALNWIYLDYNSGTPIVDTTVTFSDIDLHSEIILGRVYRIGTELHILQAGQRMADYNTIDCKRAFEVDGFSHATGSVTSAGTGIRTIDVTEGVWYCAHNRIVTPAVDTGAGGDFTYWYNVAGVLTADPLETQINNTQYDDGTDLATLTNNRYGVHWVYLDPDGHVHIQVGTGDYLLAGAQAALVPIPPAFISSVCFLIAKIIIQKSAAAFQSVSTTFETEYIYATPVDHNDLGNIQGDLPYEHSDQGTSVADTPTFAGLDSTAKVDITGTTEQGGVGEEMDVALYVGDSVADHIVTMLKGILPVAQDYMEVFGGEDTSGQFGKGFIVRHLKATAEYAIYYSTSGKFDGTETLLFKLDDNGDLHIAGDVELINPNPSGDVDSNDLILIANHNAGVGVQTGSIKVAYGAQPYIRLSPPNAAGAETAGYDFSDLAISPSGSKDIGTSGNKFVNLHLSGRGNALEILLTGQSAPAHAEGLLFYDSDKNALTFYNDNSELAMQIGEELWIKGKAAEDLLEGQVVYISGASSPPLPDFTKAIGTTGTAGKTMAMVTQPTASSGAAVTVTTFGLVRDLDTSSGGVLDTGSENWTPGTELFLSTTVVGAMTSTKPTADRVVRVGWVLRQSATIGVIFVSLKPVPAANGIIIDDAGGLITATEVEAALQENRTLLDTHATRHAGVGGDPVDHDTLTNYVLAQHRIINDAGSSASELWSAQKILAEISALSSGVGRKDAVKDYVDNTAAPPTEVDGDRYILDDTGVSHADWDGAPALAMVEFVTDTWIATVPEEGWVTYSDAEGYDRLYVDDGAPAWELRNYAGAAHKNSHDPEDGSDPLDTAAPSELAAVQAAAVGTSHSLARADHAHQIQHAISDNHLLTVDGTANQPVATDYAKFTAEGLEGLDASQMITDLAHKDSHDPEDGGDALDCAAPGTIDENANAEGSSHSFARADHNHQHTAALHENGGGAEISAAGLSGELADVQVPKYTWMTMSWSTPTDTDPVVGTSGHRVPFIMPAGGSSAAIESVMATCETAPTTNPLLFNINRTGGGTNDVFTLDQDIALATTDSGTLTPDTATCADEDFFALEIVAPLPDAATAQNVVVVMLIKVTF